MPSFNYHAEKQGKMIKGTINAASIQMANLKIKANNMEPIYVVEKSLIPFISSVKKVPAKDIMFITRQLAFLLTSGLSIVQALELVQTMPKNPSLKTALKQILQKVRGGLSFSKSLRSCPHIFTEFYVNMIVCAEETGLMDQTLEDLALYMEKAENIRSKIRSAMMYPVIVLSIAVLIITGIIVFVVPQFQALYGGAGGKLPALTQLLVNLSTLFRNHWYFVLAGLFLLPLVLSKYFQTSGGQKQLEKIVDSLPLFGRLQYQSGLARFCRSFSSLLKSGVNFLDALDISYSIAGHAKIMAGLKVAREAVSQGSTFARGLSKTKVFPPLFTSMAAIGEESGKLNGTFTKLAEFYEMEVDNMVTGLIKLIEPIMITVLGAMIGIIILALYLPVFKLGDVI